MDFPLVSALACLGFCLRCCWDLRAAGPPAAVAGAASAAESAEDLEAGSAVEAGAPAVAAVSAVAAGASAAAAPREVGDAVRAPHPTCGSVALAHASQVPQKHPG